MSPPGIEFRQVSKRYGDAASPLVVQGIDLTVPKGTLTTLLGPSGCGKTTTLRMIAGLESPTAGSIFIDGQDVTTLGPAERNVSMVFQSYALFPHMTVERNVGYGLQVSGLGAAETARRVRDAMALVGLEGYGARMPAELSGGQQQRVAVARSLVLEPSVLLFDEPLSNLDARLRRSMREEIRALQQRLKLTVAYVTHDQAEALAVSDQIIVMDAGRGSCTSSRPPSSWPASWARPSCSRPWTTARAPCGLARWRCRRPRRTGVHTGLAPCGLPCAPKPGSCGPGLARRHTISRPPLGPRSWARHGTTRPTPPRRAPGRRPWRAGCGTPPTSAATWKSWSTRRWARSSWSPATHATTGSPASRCA